MGNAGKGRDAYLREVLYVIFKRKKLVLSVLALVMLGVAGGLLLSRPQYEASAILMVKRDRGELVVTPAQGSAGNVNLRVNLDQDLNSEAELLKRRSLLVRVAQTIGTEALVKGRLVATASDTGPVDGLPSRALQLFQEAFGVARPVLAVVTTPSHWITSRQPVDEVERAVEALDAKLQVSAVMNSNLIRVSYVANDPRLAGACLELLVKNYLDEYTKIRATPGVVDFFERQVKTLAGELKTAEESLRDFDLKQGITSVSRQRELYLSTGTEREVALRLARSAVEELQEKSRALRAQLQQLPETIPLTEETRRSPLRDTLAQKLLEFQIERTKLLQKYMESDRRVQDIEREITALRDRFLSAGEWEVARKTYGINPARNPLLMEVVQTEAQLLREQIRVAHLEQDTREFVARLRHLDAMAMERARQERDVKMLEEAYLLYSRKYEEARISTALDQSRIVNIALAEPVQVTRRGSSRGPLQLSLLGAIVGLVSGVALAFCREAFSHSFTTDDSVRRHLGLPVLGSIPDERERKPRS